MSHIRSREFEDLPNWTTPHEMISDTASDHMAHSTGHSAGHSSVHASAKPALGTSINADDIRVALEKFGTIPKSSRIGAYLGEYIAIYTKNNH